MERFIVTEKMAHDLEKISYGDGQVTINMHTLESSQMQYSDFREEFAEERISLFEDESLRHPFSICVKERIGEGGGSIIDTAVQLGLGREVAIKRLRKNKRDSTGKKNIIAEARLLAQLDHPNILPVHVLGFDDEKCPIILMKRVKGSPWSKILKSQSSKRTDKQILRENLQNLIQVCRAIAINGINQAKHTYLYDVISLDRVWIVP